MLGIEGQVVSVAIIPLSQDGSRGERVHEFAQMGLAVSQ